MKQKVLVFIVAYNAERFIEDVFNRIPDTIWNHEKYDAEILVIDDCSKDETFRLAELVAIGHRGRKRVTVLYNPKNQGYGGNQKIGYHYAIENGFDYVVLLHGDGQYAPEVLPDMLEPLLRGEADAVFGSRMLRKTDALRGGMPLYKWFGNQILTAFQNRIMGCNLSEFHSGYRAYSIKTLKLFPFEFNSDYFDFDTDIIVQLILGRKRIREIPIPTYYGDEICHVNGIKYGFLILLSCLKSRVQHFGIFYERKFDLQTQNRHYVPKFGFDSSHQFALDQVRPDSTVLDLGCGPGFMARALKEKRVRTISVDRYIQNEAREHSAVCVQADLDTFALDAAPLPVPDTILVLDIIEHIRRPEDFLLELRKRYSLNLPQIVLTTGNVGFFSIRLGLLFGKFNYGKKGILDSDHTRLFTFATLEKALRSTGYEILQVRGIPAPFPAALGNGTLARLFLRINQLLIRVSKSLFSYQIAVIAEPKPTLDVLLERANYGRQMQVERLSLKNQVSAR